MNLQFENFTEDDLPRLLDLWVESWSEVYAGIDFNERCGWLTAHIMDWLSSGGLCRVVREKGSGAIAGFILLKAESGHLDQICVSAGLKGHGVASRLLHEARQLSPSGLHLDVNAMNHRAIRFYVREGFEKTGEGVNPRSGLPIHHYRWRP